MIRENKQLIPVISLLLASGFLITSLASYFVSRAALRAEIAVNELPLTGDNIYSEIQRDLLRPVFISSVMANDTFLRDWVLDGEKEEGKITRYLKEIKTKYNTVSSFFVSDKTKTYYYSGGILKKISPDDERDIWYYRVREMGDEYEINVDPDMANRDTMTIFINYRVYDYDGRYIGATGVGLTVSAVKRLIEEYQKKYSRTIYFIDKAGEVKLSGEDFSGVATGVSGSYGPLSAQSDSGAASSFSYKEGGELIHVNARYISEFGWYLIVEQAEGETTRHIFATLLVNLAFCAMVTMVVLFLVTMTIRAYQKRIETLRGIVPICSFCKQIRDDKGYWNQVESYVAKHTDAEFSHGVCPACQKKHYPDVFGQENKS